MYTLGEAAKATGASKATISRALKSGRISGKKDEGGTYSIDPAELHRVFPPLSRNPVQETSMERSATPEKADETGGLRREVELLREQREEERSLRDRERDQLNETIHDLRKDRDRLVKVIEDQALTMKLLTDQAARPAPEAPIPVPAPVPAPMEQPQPVQPPRKGFLARLFGS